MNCRKICCLGAGDRLLKYLLSKPENLSLILKTQIKPDVVMQSQNSSEEMGKNPRRNDPACILPVGKCKLTFNTSCPVCGWAAALYYLKKKAGSICVCVCVCVLRVHCHSAISFPPSVISPLALFWKLPINHLDLTGLFHPE